MAKKSYKVECISSNSRKDAITIQFAVGVELQAATEPGKPAERVTRTVINITSTDAKEIDSLSAFKAGKTYAISLE